MDLQKIDLNNWQAPELSPDMPHGDMPGDKIKIDDGHIQKATTIFPSLTGSMGISTPWRRR